MTGIFVPRKTQKLSNTPVPKVDAPALYITGQKDYVFKYPDMVNYLRSGAVKRLTNLFSHLSAKTFSNKTCI